VLTPVMTLSIDSIVFISDDLSVDSIVFLSDDLSVDFIVFLSVVITDENNGINT
jgi:hypothetical protein